jgi:hypothetical protein
VDRDNIEQKIQNKEFDLVIYGPIHRELHFYDLVRKIYDPQSIIYLCGDDEHRCNLSLHNLFLREFAQNK